MKKSYLGYLLLALLVTTGLAGIVTDTSLTQKERKAAINLMKDTRDELVKTVKDLSDAQLNFKPSRDQWSVRETIYHVVITEQRLWDLLQKTMAQQPNAERRTDIGITDEEVIRIMTDRTEKLKTRPYLEPGTAPWSSSSQALSEFKVKRVEHIKYIKTTTEDLRNHVVDMPFGAIDCYQLSLAIPAHLARHLEQVREIMASKKFPR